MEALGTHASGQLINFQSSALLVRKAHVACRVGGGENAMLLVTLPGFSVSRTQSIHQSVNSTSSFSEATTSVLPPLHRSSVQEGEGCPYLLHGG